MPIRLDSLIADKVFSLVNRSVIGPEKEQFLHIDKQIFTKSTSKGLSDTLTSRIAITDYLVPSFDFNYVLTGKINQDALKVLTIKCRLLIQ